MVSGREPTEAEILGALLRKMNAIARATFNEESRRFEIVYTDDRGRSSAFVFPIEPERLWRLIQEGGESIRDALWPDASVEEACLSLFSVHLTEAMEMANDGERVLIKVPGGIRAV